MSSRYLTVSLLLASSIVSGTAQALIIEDDFSGAWPIPPGNPAVNHVEPWTRVRFLGTGMAIEDDVLHMTTLNNRGVYFGNVLVNGDRPDWNFGAPAVGGYVALDFKLASGSADWSVYFYDSTGNAAVVEMNPAGGYTQPVSSGLRVTHADGGSGTTSFFAVDLTDDFHRLEILLKDAVVSYALDGELLYSGAALDTNNGPLLVIGDGSGSTPTGKGSMYVDWVKVDTAPTIDALAPVPVPAALPLLGGALGIVAPLLRRRRARAR